MATDSANPNGWAVRVLYFFLSLDDAVADVIKCPEQALSGKPKAAFVNPTAKLSP